MRDTRRIKGSSNHSKNNYLIVGIQELNKFGSIFLISDCKINHYLTFDLKCGGLCIEVICLQPNLSGQSGITTCIGLSSSLHNIFELIILLCKLLVAFVF